MTDHMDNPYYGGIVRCFFTLRFFFNRAGKWTQQLKERCLSLREEYALFLKVVSYLYYRCLFTSESWMTVGVNRRKVNAFLMLHMAKHPSLEHLALHGLQTSWLGKPICGTDCCLLYFRTDTTSKFHKKERITTSKNSWVTGMPGRWSLLIKWRSLPTLVPMIYDKKNVVRGTQTCTVRRANYTIPNQLILETMFRPTVCL